MTDSGISYIDLAIAVVLIFFIIRGFKKGFTEEFMRMISTLISLGVATKHMKYISKYLTGNDLNFPPELALFLSFTILFVATFFAVRYTAQYLKKVVSFSVVLGGADKIVGAALGVFKGAIIVSLLTILVSLVDFSDSVKRQISESQLFNPMKEVAPFVYDAVKKLIKSDYNFAQEIENSVSGIEKAKRGAGVNALIEELK